MSELYQVNGTTYTLKEIEEIAIAAIKEKAELVAKVEAEYQRSWSNWEKLQRQFFNDEEYDEEYDDTLTRKYEEGYSDALAMVRRLLEEENQ